MPQVNGLDHMVLTVGDVDRTCRFYRDVLGVEIERFEGADGVSRLALRLGRQKINLHQAGAEIRPHAERPMPGSADICLLSSDPVEDWQAHLDAAGWRVELGPVQRSGACGPILSLYLRDPDRNLVEIATALT